MVANKKYVEVVTPFLKGIRQIMLQESPWTGLFFLVGLFCSSCLFGLAAIFSVITGTLTARVLKYPDDEINKGLYGFSAALVGVALVYFYKSDILLWAAVFIGSILAAVIQHGFIKIKIPAFTFPFVLVTWLFFIFSHFLPTIYEPLTAAAELRPNSILALFSNGFGQVIFQNNIFAGLLFITGVFVGRPVAGVYALGAVGLSAVLAWILQEPVADIYLGLFSYNAVLCVIVFAGKEAAGLLWAFLSTLLSVLVMIQMRRMNIPALTFPFVLATWLVLSIKAAIQIIQKKSEAPG